MISQKLRADFMERLRKKPKAKYPINVFKEHLFTDQSVRYLAQGYRSGEMARSAVFARLGETAGLFLLALTDGYSVKDVARTAKVTPREVRQSILDGCKRAKMFGLIPDFDESLTREVNGIAHYISV